MRLLLLLILPSRARAHTRRRTWPLVNGKKIGRKIPSQITKEYGVPKTWNLCVRASAPGQWFSAEMIASVSVFALSCWAWDWCDAFRLTMRTGRVYGNAYKINMLLSFWNIFCLFSARNVCSHGALVAASVVSLHRRMHVLVFKLRAHTQNESFNCM